MSDKIYGITVESVEGWQLTEDGRVLVKCAAPSGGSFLLTAPIEAVGDLVNSLLSAFGDAQKRDDQPKQSVQALYTNRYDIGRTPDGSVVLTLFNRDGAGIPFYLPRAMAETLAESLERTLGGAAVTAPPDRTQH